MRTSTLNWYKKAQEEDDDLLADSFYEVIDDEKNKVRQGDLKSWPDGEWLGKTVTDAIMERANKLLSMSGVIVPEAYSSEVVIRVKNALGSPGVTKDKYLNKMAGFLAVSALFGQSMDSVEVSLSSDKECEVYAMMLGAGTIKSKKDLSSVREVYIERFLNSPLNTNSIAGIIIHYLPSKTASIPTVTKTSSSNHQFIYDSVHPKLIKAVVVDCEAIDKNGKPHDVTIVISDSGTADVEIHGMNKLPWLRITDEIANNPSGWLAKPYSGSIEFKQEIVNFAEVVKKCSEAYKAFDEEVTRVYDNDVADAMATRMMEESSSRPRIRIAEESNPVSEEEL